uniref:Macro domain protein n=1 Tax=Marseillevirus LCMAC201 TaxID=2506605 RepID=A0A481YXH4_9VIRU|nr:MAG: macro domain protein [Marseillevirus LCMAC201]
MNQILDLSTINFTIIDLDPQIVKIFEQIFANLPNFVVKKVKKGYIAKNSADCLVSPANSFGLMDGGVDKEINEVLFIERRVQAVIHSKHRGEQLVGTCELVPTYIHTYPFLAHTPTMRTPTDVSKTDNAYISFRAFLTCLIQHNTTNRNEIHTVLLTPFCTGTGKMLADRSAMQMRLAYDQVQRTPECNWMNANEIAYKLAL